MLAFGRGGTSFERSEPHTAAFHAGVAGTVLNTRLQSCECLLETARTLSMLACWFRYTYT
jgi:hypothetical protein